MNTIKKFIKIIQEDIIGPGNQLMAVVWLGCLGGVIGLVFYTTSESKSFLGVAESRDQQISFEYAVEIKQMHIIPGQSIRKGDLLMELDQSELNSRIRGVRAQLAKLESEKLVRQHLNGLINNSSESSLSDSLVSDPLIVEIKDLKLQLGDLEEQRKNLYIFASRDGIISGIHFRKGEKVSAFTNIINISSEHPTYVEGFIHETLNTKLEIGKLVEVTALSSGHQTYGKVIGIGSKIVLMPTRLMAHSAMQVYGREVVVEIPVENGFLLGEKVQITPKMSH